VSERDGVGILQTEDAHLDAAFQLRVVERFDAGEDVGLLLFRHADAK
jgi:hypothetical protein